MNSLKNTLARWLSTTSLKDYGLCRNKIVFAYSTNFFNGVHTNATSLTGSTLAEMYNLLFKISQRLTVMSNDILIY